MECGSRLGSSYRIIEELGNGGNGTVYLVCHINTEQIRAAKRLRSGKDGTMSHEIQMMKHLRHPGLPQIFDVIEQQGETWLIMEYIRGKCISAMRQEDRTEEVFFSVARQLTETLLYLHTRTPPIFHLDIKPTNVILRQDGSIVLIDFGAAIKKKNRKGEHNSWPGMGTPGFAAPEQFLPESSPDERTDLYGLCATLYYFLYGRLFRPDNNDHMRRRTWTEIRSHKHWKKLAERRLREGLQTDKEQRPESVWVFYRKLKQIEFIRKVERQWKAGVGAFCFLLFSTVFTVSAYLTRTAEEIPDFAGTDCLEQARLLGIEQAVPYYQQAARRDCTDTSWYPELLDKVIEDGIFDQEEEKILNELLYGTSFMTGERTLLECWKEDGGSEFGDAAYRTGLAYWYYYSGSGGKRAAANWFQIALEHDAGEAADLYLKLAQSYFALEDKSGETQPESVFRDYYQILKEIYDQEMGVTMQIQKQLTEELLSLLIFHAYEMWKSGVGKEEMNVLVKKLQNESGNLYQEKTDQKAYLERCRAALDAIERNVGT